MKNYIKNFQIITKSFKKIGGLLFQKKEEEF